MKLILSSYNLAATLLLLAVEATAALRTDKPFHADSPVGQRLLEKAIVVAESSSTTNDFPNLRRTADQYQYDNQYGVSNLASLYIQYKGCSSFLAPDQGDDGASGDGGGVNYYYYQEGDYQAQQQEQDGDVVYNDGIVQQNLVLFTLCSKSSCGSCSGDYAVDMSVFLEAYTEMQMEGDEYQCEYVREHCYCSNGYYESCLETCYSNAGLDDCMQEYYGGEAFQLQEYIECQGTLSYE